MTDSIARPALRRSDHGVATLHDLMVPMRDGIRLATDIYSPNDNGGILPGPWPVVVERTPYDKLRSQTPSDRKSGATMSPTFTKSQ
jgi:hypothetical protein